MRILIAAACLVCLSLGTAIGYGVGLSQANAAAAATMTAHAEADARLRVACVTMGVMAERGLNRASVHLWAHRGVTGGDLGVLSPAGQRSGAE